MTFFSMISLPGPGKRPDLKVKVGVRNSQQTPAQTVLFISRPDADKIHPAHLPVTPFFSLAENHDPAL